MAVFLRSYPFQQDALSRADVHTDAEGGESVALDKVVDAAAMLAVAEEEEGDLICAV